MTTQTLHIEFESHEGALLRLIGLVERRGYDVSSINMPTENAGRMTLDLGVMARNVGSDIGILQRQIHRLVGVHRVFGSADPAHESSCNSADTKGGQNGKG